MHKTHALSDGTENYMQDITQYNTYEKNPEWNVTCHYDNNIYSKEPASFIECMALFMLAEKQGWDINFMPSSQASASGIKDGRGTLL